MRSPSARANRPGTLATALPATEAKAASGSPGAAPTASTALADLHPHFKKKLLSNDIRAKCDMSLFLNMFPTREVKACRDLPDPLETRAAEVVKRAGVRFENEIFENLQGVFGDLVVAAPVSSEDGSVTKFADIPIERTLSRPPRTLVIVQAMFDMKGLPSALFYDAMGVGETRPEMGELKPDILFVRRPLAGQQVFAKNGRRLSLVPSDRRHVISIADVKHASEPNASYEAEVVLYGVLLANWLEAKGLSDRYAVDAQPRLWTGGARTKEILSSRGADDPAATLLALELALEKANVGVHVQEIRRFVAERVPAVLEKGRREGYKALDWHVSAACSGCEWLGNEKWLSNEQVQQFKGNEDKYCFHRARSNGHLSRIPGLTRGAVKALARVGVDTLEKLANLPPQDPAWLTHTSLTASRKSLPKMARALRDDSASRDEERVDGILPRFADLTINIFVESDAGAGLLAGVGFNSAFFRGDGSRKPEIVAEAFVTDRKEPEHEQQMVLDLLSKLGQVLRNARDNAAARHGPPSASVIFWRRSHYDDLSDAIGRHMAAVLTQGDSSLAALAWLFPSSSLQARGAILKHPTVSFLADSVRRLVHTPTPHAMTLADVAARYNQSGEDRSLPHPFYVDPFSDKIPRERIYEIWEMEEGDTKDLHVQLTYDNGKPVHDGQGRNVMRLRTVTRDEFKDMFRSALLKRAGFLSSIGQRLRTDMGARLLARAAPITLEPPTWDETVAFDSRLWIARAEFAFAHDQQRTLLRYMSEPEEVEASNEGLRLERLLSVEEDGTMEFEVVEGALASKVKAPNENAVLIPESMPGLAAMTAATLLKAKDKEIEDDLQRTARAPLHTVFAAQLISFDRSTRRARLRYKGGEKSKRARLRALVMDSLGHPGGLTGNACVFASLPPDITLERLRNTLREVGNPPIAIPDPATSAALGTRDLPAPGSSRVTPIARVLWDASTLAATRCATPSEVDDIVATSRSRNLDASQQTAVAACSERALTVVWGPPGTGKTNTLTGFLHGLAALHGRRGTPRTILVTGPTYKAVGELAQRLISTLAADPSFSLTLALVGAREMASVKDPPPHLDVVVTEADERSSAFTALVDRIYEREGVTIVCAITHQCARMAAKASKHRKRGNGATVVLDMFDTIVLDESSQVDMTTAVFPLALLREGGQVIIAGDHLQMPPVQTVDAPKGAEHMVGSIQAYLIERFGIRPVALEVNYRSNAEIVGYCRGLGYPETLRAAFPLTRLTPFRRNMTPGAKKEIAQALASKLERLGLPWSPAFEAVLEPSRGLCAMTYPDGISGQTNAFEASMVASIALGLRATMSRGLAGYRPGSEDDGVWDVEDFFARGLGVVTPHRAQKAGVVSALRKAFPDADPELIEGAVDTVERFQGGERHTIIVSFGVGDPDVIQGEERFLLGLERTNVAISRAMAKCIVLMAEEMTVHIPIDRKASEGAHAIRGIVDDWCLERLVAPTAGGPEAGRPVTARWRGFVGQ